MHRAVGLGVSGSVYMGCNVELPKLPLSASIHAEQFLLTNMRHRGEDAVHNIVVSAAPCGHCRQFITEVGCSHDIKITYGDPPASYSLDELLLHRFGPEDLLGSNPPPLMLQPQNNPVAFAPSTRKVLLLMTFKYPQGLHSTPCAAGCCMLNVCIWPCMSTSLYTPPPLTPQWMESQPPALVRAAESCLECAANAYSPYTHSPSAAALVTASGDVYCGGYVESAAYNPSLPPLQAALVEAVIGGVGDYNEVCVCVCGCGWVGFYLHCSCMRVMHMLM